MVTEEDRKMLRQIVALRKMQIDLQIEDAALSYAELRARLADTMNIPATEEGLRDARREALRKSTALLGILPESDEKDDE